MSGQLRLAPGLFCLVGTQPPPMETGSDPLGGAPLPGLPHVRSSRPPGSFSASILRNAGKGLWLSCPGDRRPQGSCPGSTAGDWQHPLQRPGAWLLCSFFNSFIVRSFKRHQTHPFKVCNSMTFSIFTTRATIPTVDFRPFSSPQRETHTLEPPASQPLAPGNVLLSLDFPTQDSCCSGSPTLTLGVSWVEGRTVPPKPERPLLGPAHSRGL